MTGRRGEVLAVGKPRVPRPPTSLAARIAAISIVGFQAYVGVVCPLHAEDLGQSGVVDIAQFTCNDLQQMPVPRALVLVGWIAGFYAGRIGETRVDVPAALDSTDRVLGECRKNGSRRLRLMNLAEQEFRRNHNRPPLSRPDSR